MRRVTINLLSALRSLREQWQRAFLSGLGIMVGAVAIVLLVSIAKGVQQDITSQVREIGVNILIVIPGRIEEGTFNPNLGGQSFLQEQDAAKLQTIPGVIRAAPWTFVGGGIRNGDKTATPILVATTAEWFQMHRVDLQEGRAIGPGDDLAAVCLIGSVAKKALFGESPALGKKVTINKQDFTVLGVTRDKQAEQSLFSMGSLQNLVYLPYHFVKKTEANVQTDRIMVQIQPEAEPRQLIKAMDSALLQRLDKQQFQVLTQEDLLGLVYKLMSILTWLLTGLTSIALFVGGVGIMAVMLMSVSERSKEIGIRKAVGARRADIFQQFLAESILLGLSGGAVGLVVSDLVCLALAAWTPIKPLVTWGTVALAFGVCTGVGALFGLIPAMKAAKKDPVAALRNE